MYGDKYNEHTNQLINEYNKTHLFDLLTTSIFAGVLIICLFLAIYVLSKKGNLEKTLLILFSFVTIMVIAFTVTDKYSKITTSSNNFKTEHLFTNGSNVGSESISSDFLDETSQEYLDKYVKSLELKRTKDYSDIQYTTDGKMSFYFKGKKYVTDNTSLLNIKETKKPIMTYKVIDRNIQGLYLKGDIINIDFAVNY